MAIHINPQRYKTHHSNHSGSNDRDTEDMDNLIPKQYKQHVHNIVMIATIRDECFSEAADLPFAGHLLFIYIF